MKHSKNILEVTLSSRKTTSSRFFILGLVPNRIDLLMEAAGPDFSEAFASRIRAREGDLEFNLVALQDLLAMKRAANRPQDQADIAALDDPNLLNLGQDGGSEKDG